jgi:hypothetical protein
MLHSNINGEQFGIARMSASSSGSIVLTDHV